MTLGDPVRVLAPEYPRAGEVGRVSAFHGVLDDWVFVEFKGHKRAELIWKADLEMVEK